MFCLEGSYWSIPSSQIMHSLEGNLFMLGFGGIVVVTLSSYSGRLPILIYFLAGALVTSAWSAAAGNFPSFMTARILNGFFSTVAQAVSSLWFQNRRR
jgi:predicted MFS family arabinose efflux permease